MKVKTIERKNGKLVSPTQPLNPILQISFRNEQNLITNFGYGEYCEKGDKISKTTKTFYLLVCRRDIYQRENPNKVNIGKLHVNNRPVTCFSIEPCGKTFVVLECRFDDIKELTKIAS